MTERILLIDDESSFAETLAGILVANQYQVQCFVSAREFLSVEASIVGSFDLVLSDVRLPGLSGYELCKIIRSWDAPGYIPIILMTGSTGEEKIGLEAGADDLIEKPFSFDLLLAKIRTLLKVRARHMAALSKLDVTEKENSELFGQLKSEIEKVERLGKLSRFVPAKVAELVAKGESQKVLEQHENEVTVMFVDLRNFTKFTQSTGPDEVLRVLNNYYQVVGTLAQQYGGTLGHLAGDGIMVFFNDPDPIPRHCEVATQMALALREKLSEARERWRAAAYPLDFGIGLAEGRAVIGGIGFEEFWHYSVIGLVTNLASRLCARAQNGEILITRRFSGRLNQGKLRTQDMGRVHLKGIDETINVLNVIDL